MSQLQNQIFRNVPLAFILRRIHSLMGLWLFIFLCEHLMVNFHAAFWIGEDGKRFIALVNQLQAIPFLPTVEGILIGVPILVHTLWGIEKVYLSKTNVFSFDKKEPSLFFIRNIAFTFQRLSSWVLIAGISFHVVQMRWIHYPQKAILNQKEWSMVKISNDEGLVLVAQRLNVKLYDYQMLKEIKHHFNDANSSKIAQNKPFKENVDYLRTIGSFSLCPHEYVAIAPDRGTAMLLIVRDVFKSPWMNILYSLFVLAAVFHAVNGFWTFLLTWGIIISTSIQNILQWFGWGIMFGLLMLGLFAIWITYFINLRF